MVADGWLRSTSEEAREFLETLITPPPPSSPYLTLAGRRWLHAGRAHKTHLGTLAPHHEEDEEDDAIDDAMELGDVGRKRGARYDDIFAPPSLGGKRKASEDTGGGEDEDGVLANSRFAQSQQALQDTIGELEDERLAPKPWQLKGETSARQRPQNSLLEAEAETLEFERAVAPAPEVTLERSVALEEIIKQRIVDENFDDVVRLPSAAEQAQARLNASHDVHELTSVPHRKPAALTQV